MQQVACDTEVAQSAGWAIGDAEICRTWGRGGAQPDLPHRLGGGEVEVLDNMKILGGPLAWEEPKASGTWCAKHGENGTSAAATRS